MRRTRLYLSVTFAVTILVSLQVGFWLGRHASERQWVVALDMEVGSESVQKFFVADKALKGIQDSRYNDATRVLLQYAKLQIPRVRDCKASERCAAWSGGLLPSDAEVDKVSTMSMPAADVR